MQVIERLTSCGHVKARCPTLWYTGPPAVRGIASVWLQARAGQHGDKPVDVDGINQLRMFNLHM